jgi:hypothetical protein
MSMLEERLQVLIHRDQRERLERQSHRRGASVGALVRTPIDLAYPSTADERRAAAERFLAAEPMEVPDVPDRREELDELRGRSGTSYDDV